MRGSDQRTGELFSYVDLEKRVPAKHPLRLVRSVVNEVLAALGCQSASKFDPRSASNFDPLERRVRAVALAPSELVGVAETARARVVW